MQFSSCASLSTDAKTEPDAGAGELGAPDLAPDTCEVFFAIPLQEEKRTSQL